MEIGKTFYPLDRKEWRKWLSKNHKKENEIWLIYYKKDSGKPRVAYDDAVEEALCFGWIDSTVKKIDEEKYCQKFSPRNEKSIWSLLNKKRVEKLIKSKKMTRFGLAKIEIAKKNGMWEKLTVGDSILAMPAEFEVELKKHKNAQIYFNSLAPSHRKNYINWIASAKKQETVNKRIAKSIEMLSKNQKLGMI
ncbi:MAG: YdeI/OmpD-associated family protein [Ignavibacteriales bacterium]|nr:YdeI/OmpD-associated family protein [Ignavibacteriales bacterium]